MPPRILIVEDDPECRASLLLHLDGIDADEAGNWSQAIELLRANDYDVALWDLGLPDRVADPVGAFAYAREFAPRPVYVVVTGMDRRLGYREQCIEAGADYYLDKPADRDHLRATVAAALRLQRQRADARRARTGVLAGVHRVIAEAQRQIEASTARPGVSGHVATLQ